jgi:signal transduction histidine kinase
VRLVAAGTALLLAISLWLMATVADEANATLTGRTVAALEADSALLRATFEREGLDGLARRITDLERTNARLGLYRLEAADGRRIAGNLDNWPLATGTQRGGTFVYAPPPAPDTRAAGVGIAIELPEGARLLVGRDVEDQRRLGSRIRWLGWLGLGGLAAAGLGFAVIARRALLQRVETINVTARAIMAGDLHQRIPREHTDDELDRLAANLNDMLARIDALMASLREVSDNIAHDLRTPLNRLRNTAEAALRDGAAAGSARAGFEKVIEQADDLIKTFNALLLIAKLDPGPATAQENVDLAGLVADVGELYQPVAEEAGLGLALDIPPAPATVRANRQLVGQAVANLIDNAIKYSADAPAAAGKPIEVGVAVRADRVVVTVADHGLGIAPQDRARALERFVRLESSRSSPGTGLGLSLVAAVARMHGAALVLDDNMPGLKVSLDFPSA